MGRTVSRKWSDEQVYATQPAFMKLVFGTSLIPVELSKFTFCLACFLSVTCEPTFAASEVPTRTDSPMPQAFPAADLEFLRDLTREVVEQSRVKAGSRVGQSPTNTCGYTLIMPGGRGGYPAL